MTRKSKKVSPGEQRTAEDRLEHHIKNRMYEADYLLAPRDKPKTNAALGVRVVLTVVAWLVLAFKVQPGSGYFVSLFLFATPLIVDYVAFEPDGILRKLCWKIAIAAAGIWAVIGFMGGIGLIAIENTANGLVISSSSDFIYSIAPVSLERFHSLLLVSVVFTLVDFIVYKSTLEFAMADYAIEQAATRKGG